MVRGVMAAISSKKHQMTPSRLVSRVLQSLCKMRGEVDQTRLREGEIHGEFIRVLPVQQL